MLDIADAFCPALARVQQFLQPRFSLAERQTSQVHAISKQQIECKEDQLIRLAIGDRRLEAGEVRDALLIQRDDLTIDQDIRQRGCLFGYRLELIGPVEPLAGLEADVALFDAKLHTVTVELDLVAPALAVRRPLDRRAKLRLDEVRHVRDFPYADRRRNDSRGCSFR